MRRSLCILLAMLCLCVSLCGCAAEEPLPQATLVPDPTPQATPAPSPRPATTIVRDLIDAYGRGGEAESETAEALLSELEASDPEEGALWREIMAYWRFTRTDMAVHCDAVPDGLPEDDSLCIAVLGYQLNPDGSMREELVGRLEAALACAERYPKAYVLCTGGGTASANASATEADAMAAWLAEKGVAPERLIVENRSLSTVQNALFSCDILRAEYPQVKRFLVVSSSYHIPWGALLFDAAGLKAAHEEGGDALRVAENFAYETQNPSFPEESLLSWQSSGLRSLFGVN